MEIDSTSSGANALGGNGVGEASTDFDRDAFMQLLVTQIRNQDPMDPMDTRDMMAQLTQLTSVEHLIGIEQGVQTLGVASASIANAQVAGFVGKTVTADASSLRLEEAGSAAGAFELDGRASNVTVTIRDEEGRVVRTMELEGDRFAGTHRYEWDGMDDSGTRLPEGRYRVEVSATDGEGQPVGADTEVRGTVTGVSYEHGYPELILDGEHKILMGDVRRVDDGPGGGAGATREPSGASGTSTAPPTAPGSLPELENPSLIDPSVALSSYTR